MEMAVTESKWIWRIEIFNKLEIQFICRAAFSQAALFLLPCIRKELPVAGPVDIKVCKRSCRWQVR